MIALLCSVQTEAEHLHSKLQITGTATAGSKAIAQGMLAGQRVLLCAGGMGKVNAAHTATVMITEFDPEALIVFGIGGAYPSSGARIGDVVLAREEIAGDEDGQPTETYPLNPNGSKGGATGYTTADGRFTIMMPHPERVFRAAQLSWKPAGYAGDDGPWMRMFRNARKWVG